MDVCGGVCSPGLLSTPGCGRPLLGCDFLSKVRVPIFFQNDSRDKEQSTLVCRGNQMPLPHACCAQRACVQFEFWLVCDLFLLLSLLWSLGMFLV